MGTLLSPAVQKAVAGGSAIRKMFEQGIELKKKFGADNVYDFSLGNPDLAPRPCGRPRAVKPRAIGRLGRGGVPTPPRPVRPQTGLLYMKSDLTAQTLR